MASKQAQRSQTKAKKQAIVSELTEKVKSAKAVVFTNYQGLTHKQLEAFKKNLKKANAEFVVSKNTLLKIAFQKKGSPSDTSGTFDTFDTSALAGPTGTIFAYGDIVSPLKELAKMIKDFKLPEIKLGILEERTLTAADVTKLSSLPSKEVLIAQVVGGIKSPLFGLHRALNWNLQKLVLTLNAISLQKSKS